MEPLSDYLVSSSTLTVNHRLQTPPATYTASGQPCSSSEHPQFALLNARPTSPTASSLVHVFVRHDAIRKPLQQPYDGPYKVISRSDKHFTLDIQGTRKTVSLDRLKPTYLESTTTSQDTATQPSPVTSTTPPAPPPASPAPPPRTTCSGRHVRWPDRFHF